VAEVRVAADGAAGLEMWRSWRPDLVITDIQMPGMDGLEMSEAIKREDAFAQVIVVTSSSDSEHLQRALDVGIGRYIVKPVEEEPLLATLRKCLGDLLRTRSAQVGRLVFESVKEGMLVTDEYARILSVNPAFCQVTGFEEAEVLGKRPSILSSGLQDARFYQDMWECLHNQGRWEGEVINRRKNGELYTEWLSIVAVEDASRQAIRYVGLFSDITERKLEEDRIRRMAHYDILTGLPNRVLFMDRLKRALVRLGRRGGNLALLYLDLDRFKPLNDLHGHAFGDQVLVELARRMAACVRDVDMVSRRGGDEFVILIEAEDAREASAMVAGKLIQEVSQPCTLSGQEVSLGASVGVALYPQDGMTAEALVEAADTALYAAKRSGRGCVRYYSQASDQATASA
jgi:diguanylate cyclase (GGDEF)-like protein/PAS domain S-box-containing protein